MGTPKGLLSWGGRPLLSAHVEAAHAAGLRVRVVLGAADDAHRSVLPADVEVVHNLRWAETDMAESVALGLEGLAAALVMPVDTPVPRPDTLRRLADQPGCAVPTWQGRDGHPVRVARMPRVRWPPEGRLDAWLREAPRVPVDDPAVAGNLNTPESLRTWLPGR
ncbi:MAG: hypothetical protein RLZZ299_215 [Pseudomonadota bacterium]